MLKESCTVRFALATALMGAWSLKAFAGQLVINSNQSDPAPKAAFTAIIKKFEQENPDIKVSYNEYDHEAYKTALRNWLSTSPPDVVYWFAGNRMKEFVNRGLFDDVSDLWQKEGLDKGMSSVMRVVTIDGKQWGVPYTYYQWGVYYRKDLFEKNGLGVPKTWDEFLAACKKLKGAGVTPIAIGTKFPWTAAGWFDYLNLRTNGYDFHMQLMDGKVAYTDQRVKKVFDHWRQLIEPGYFLANHPSYSWQEALPFILNGKAAMYLIGNFAAANFGDKKDLMGFFPFPSLNPAVPPAEDAPTDSLHIPARAKNKADARKFLAFMARPDIQSELNMQLGQIPPHQQARTKEDPFLLAGAALLQAAQGKAQFYDRDTSPELAKEGMKGFQEFMVKPERLDKILSHLDALQKQEGNRRIF